MSTTIHHCGFDSAGGQNFAPINPLQPLQSRGDLDISQLLRQIVQEDFGYTGTDQYTLTLKNNRMTLELLNGPSSPPFGILTLDNGQWTLSKPSERTHTVLTNTTAISTRAHTTLDRISRAYQNARPSEIPSPHQPAAQVHATPTPASTSSSTGPVIHNNITCNHTDLTAAIAAFQHTMDSCLQLLKQHQSTPQASTNTTEVQALQKSVEELHQKLEQLKRADVHPQHAVPPTTSPSPQQSQGNKDTSTLQDRQIKQLQFEIALGEYDHQMQQQIEQIEAAKKQSDRNAQEALAIATELEQEKQHLQTELACLQQQVQDLSLQHTEIQNPKAGESTPQPKPIDSNELQDQLALVAIELAAQKLLVESLTQKNQILHKRSEELHAELLTRYPETSKPNPEIAILRQKVSTLQERVRWDDNALKAGEMYITAIHAENIAQNALLQDNSAIIEELHRDVEQLRQVNAGLIQQYHRSLTITIEPSPAEGVSPPPSPTTPLSSIASDDGFPSAEQVEEVLQTT